MRRHIGIGGILAGLLAILLASCAGLSFASAEGVWPEETLTDAENRTYKQVKKQDGGVEVWQLIGIFGSPDEALELVGLSEEDKKADEGSYTEEQKTGTETIDKLPFKFKMSKKKVPAKLSGLPEPRTIREPETGAVEEKPKKASFRRRPKTLGGIIPVEQINRAFNQIFLQENRASGR